jgi:hypothetical protein
MSEASLSREDRARKNAAAVLRRLASYGQATVAAELGISESTVSRWKGDGDIERYGRLLALLGLKVVPGDWRCYPPEHVDWLLLGNRIAAEKVRTADDLLEADDE